MAKKVPKKIPAEGRVYVTATFNNTLVAITDKAGSTLFWGSSGSAGFKGARKSTPFAANLAIDNVAKKAANAGLKSVEVFLKGPGPGRDAVVRALRTTGLDITMIADVTPIPHNGCRPKKKRRV